MLSFWIIFEKWVNVSQFYFKLKLCVILERLPEAIKTGCGDCSKEEKEYAKQIVKFLVKNKKPMLEEILKKYDPNGTYKAKYQDILEN